MTWREEKISSSWYKVWVSEGLSYRESTVVYISLVLISKNWKNNKLLLLYSQLVLQNTDIFAAWKLACVAVVSVSFEPSTSGVSAGGHWAKRSKKVGAGERGGEGKKTPAAEPRHFTERRSSANGRQWCFTIGQSSVNQTHRLEQHPVNRLSKMKILAKAEKNSRVSFRFLVGFALETTELLSQRDTLIQLKPEQRTALRVNCH